MYENVRLLESNNTRWDRFRLYECIHLSVISLHTFRTWFYWCQRANICYRDILRAFGVFSSCRYQYQVPYAQRVDEKDEHDVNAISVCRLMTACCKYSQMITVSQHAFARTPLLEHPYVSCWQMECFRSFLFIT